MVDAGELDLPGGDVERRPGVPAVRAAVVAEMADVRGAVVVRRPAAHAPLRVGRVLELAPRMPLVVDPEPDGLPAGIRERGHLRVVDVEDEDRRGREVGGCGPPAVGDVLQLAVAVELVAEEVAEADGPRPHALGHLGQRALVDLEEAQVGPRDSSRVEATPETRLAPEPLWARRNAVPRISAAIAAVVVLPFVADTSAEPCGSRAASRSIAPGRPSTGAFREASYRRRGPRAATARRRPGGRDLQRERHRDAHGASLAAALHAGAARRAGVTLPGESAASPHSGDSTSSHASYLRPTRRAPACRPVRLSRTAAP